MPSTDRALRALHPADLTGRRHRELALQAQAQQHLQARELAQQAQAAIQEANTAFDATQQQFNEMAAERREQAARRLLSLVHDVVAGLNALAASRDGDTGDTEAAFGRLNDAVCRLDEQAAEVAGALL